ncbi:hypothetical protein AB0451_03245 [Streptomyces sp. NPDC052000]|uniref:hypothetical protein n=1 Tax=Streptomyces sp. NPDC052000 TaxID=3155676 RepID=UPI00344C387B
MEILLIAACAWLVHTAGAQSEQSKMGLSPAQRDILRESTRHEKAVRRIADRHGGTLPEGPAQAPAVPLSEEPVAPAAAPVLTLPEAFRSGYRGHTPIERVATPVGRHVGGWAARGVAWAEDTGKGAVREYRKRRRAKGHADPAPVLVPVPPTVPETSTEGADKSGGNAGDKKVPLTKSEPEPAPTPEPTVEPETAAPDVPPVVAQPEPPTDPGSTADQPKPTAAAGEPAAPEPTEEQPTQDTDPAAAREGVGRMAAEVTYESVLDESGELSAMCEDDLLAYDRIRDRCEREIGRADELVAQLRSPGMQAWVSRCAEQYRVILAQLDDLKSNTIAQSEAVTKAKASLESGQGFYADIAADMETVEDREFYTSDQVDGEDANAESEIYESQGA